MQARNKEKVHGLPATLGRLLRMETRGLEGKTYSCKAVAAAVVVEEFELKTFEVRPLAGNFVVAVGVRLFRQ